MWFVATSGQAIEPQKFIVAIVGANVYQGTPAEKQCAQELPGWVLYDGASLAMESTRMDNARAFIELKAWDDGACKPQAEAIAQTLRKDPRVLAVIGHATSTTTLAAAQIYADAGIPLLAPMATSPKILHPNWKPGNPGTLLKNVFRLPPGDSEVQAPAVAWVAVNTLKTRKCLLVTDVSEEAKLYSSLLAWQIKNLLQQKGKTVVDANVKSASDAVQKAKNKAPFDLIVFVGYPASAKKLLEQLRKLYNDLAHRPPLLFTDGAKTPDLDVHGFDTYLTYPVPDIAPYPAELKNDITSGNDAYEIYAYDAMLLLGQVIDQCNQSRQIGRSCILQRLRQIRSLDGGASSYSFVEGENRLSAYYVYRANGTKPGGKPPFDYFRTVESWELTAFAPGRQP
jgi:ABC-type branched-subunit amino acid transport system substrate-binding protein